MPTFRIRRRQLLVASASAVGAAAAASLVSCAPSDPSKNRTWITAYEIGRRDTLPEPGQSAVVVGNALERPWESRWYKLRGLQAGDDVTVTLRMPASAVMDYSLLGYVDIRRIARKLAGLPPIDNTNTAVLTGATPSPSANPVGAPISVLLDADDMDSDDMDSDDMDSDDMDSDDMDSDDMDSDDMDSDDMDSDDMDSDDMDSGTDTDRDGIPDVVEYRDAYSRAQRHALRAASVTPGPADEQIHMIARTGGDDLYFRVRGHQGAYDPRGRFTLEITVQKDHSCDGVDHRSVQPALKPELKSRLAGKSVLILTNTAPASTAPASLALVDRIAGRDDTSAFRSKLDAFAADPKVNGAVYDVQRDGDDQLKTLYARWEGHKTCVPLANAIVDSLRSVVRDAVTAAKSVKYVVIVGADDVIPFARIDDRAEISREWGWRGPYDAASPMGAALTFGKYLSDDPYGRLKGDLDVLGHNVRASDLAVGRLVETADDIVKHLDWYSSQGVNGITVESALVASYTFVTDLGDNIADALSGTNTKIDYDLHYDPDPNGRADTRAWSADDLAVKIVRPGSIPGFTANSFYLYKGPHQLIAAQGHYNINSLQPPNDGAKLRPTDDAVAKNPGLRGAVWMTIGCHSGHDVVDPEIRQPYDLANRFSWAETLLRLGGTLVGGTGFQYAESTRPANSEELYIYLAQQIASSDAKNNATTLALGDMLIEAKRRYLRQHPQPRGLEQKLIEVSTIYGLPMLKVGVKTPQKAPPGPPTAAPTATVALPETTVTQRNVTLEYPAARLTTLPDGRSRWSIAGGVDVTRPLRPILPGVVRDITYPGEFAVGAIWTGGTYTESSMKALIAAPSTEDAVPADRAPKYRSRAFLPARPFRIARRGGGSEHALMLTAAQYNALGGPDPQTGISRLWTAPSFTICYTPTRDGSALRAAPEIHTNERSVIDPGGGGAWTVDITVRHWASATEKVKAYASYLDASARKLVTVELSGATPSSAAAWVWERHFTGTLADSSTTPRTPPPSGSRVFFQAMGGNGRVSARTNAGRLFAPFVASSPRPTKLTNLALSVRRTAVTGTVKYRDQIDVSADLRYAANGAAVDGEVLFRLGRARIWAKTDGGVASARITVAVRPRRSRYVVVASFPGDALSGPSSASTDVTVEPAVTQFLPAAPAIPLTPGKRTEVGRLVGTSRSLTLGDRPMSILRAGRLYIVNTDASGDLRGHLLLEPADIGLSIPGLAHDLSIVFEGDDRFLPSDASSAAPQGNPTQILINPLAPGAGLIVR